MEKLLYYGRSVIVMNPIHFGRIMRRGTQDMCHRADASIWLQGPTRRSEHEDTDSARIECKGSVQRVSLGEQNCAGRRWLYVLRKYRGSRHMEEATVIE